jgi:4-methyl-5(b-hydroxyethyl)-thiazole monophosphate biosynthesis
MPGAERLRDSAVLESLVKAQKDSGRLYAAICATPYVFFETKGLIDGKVATAHPAFSDGLKDQRYDIHAPAGQERAGSPGITP